MAFYDKTLATSPCVIVTQMAVVVMPVAKGMTMRINPRQKSVSASNSGSTPAPF